MTKNNGATISADREIIKHLGGPAAVAKILDYHGRPGVARVANWMRRGIPSAIKLQRPDLFMPNWRPQAAE